MSLRRVIPSAALVDDFVTLRRPKPTDVAVIARHIGDGDAEGWLSALGTADDLYGEYEAGWSAPDEPNRLGLTLAVTRSGSDELVGVLHLEDADGVLHVGYGVAPDHRRVGIASRALALCSSWALDNGFKRVELEIGEDNQASQAVARRCGFAPTQRTRSQSLPAGGTWHARAWTLEVS